jgi:glycosyltransferase involved in cell wall biosynthesis
MRHLYHSVVYQFGNSPFHTHMLAMLAEFPGVVVLHDFFLSNLPYDREFLRGEPGVFASEIADAHGLKAVLEYARAGHERARGQWPINREVLMRANAVIVHSPFHRRLLERYYPDDWCPATTVIPQLRKLPAERTKDERMQVRDRLGVDRDTLIISSFGFGAPTKLNLLVVEAFAKLRQQFGSRAMLVFVGELEGGAYGVKVTRRITELGLGKHVRITGYSSTETYDAYLAVTDIGVQLRTDSRGETSRAVLDCLSCAIPTIVNAHGTADDYQPDTVVKLDDAPSVDDLAQALLRLAQEPELRQRLGDRGRMLVGTEHHPEHVAQAYAATILDAWQKDERRVIENIAHALSPSAAAASTLLDAIAAAASVNAALRNPRRLLIDVTRIAENDPHTGIERFVKSVIREFTEGDDVANNLELVRLHQGRLYRANRFAESMFDLPAGALGNETVITIGCGDTLFMLDSSWGFADQFIAINRQVRQQGGRVVSVLHDLIPIHHPDTCHPVVLNAFSHWLDTAVVESDLFICVSRTVADALLSHISERPLHLCRPLKIAFSHHGADVPVRSTQSTVQKRVSDWFSTASDGGMPTFLMVGTIEPRKRHALVLDAFEKVWAKGHQCRLCIIGKEGWEVAPLMKRIRSHPESDRRFMFIERATDGELHLAYQSATALIAASIAEGFGLPVVEAALHGVPSLASDISVFREVGGEGAFYFSPDDADDLAAKVIEISQMNACVRKKMTNRIKVMTWKESARHLAEIVLQGKHVYRRILPDRPPSRP